MDPKATAKSKRSHSLQGKRSSTHSSSSAAASKDKKKQPQPASQKHQQQQKHPQVAGNRPPRLTPPSLPSNWDRYEEQNHDEGEDADGSAMEAGDGVTVKSKGADFGELIEQAKSQQRDGDGGLESLFDNSVPEYIQGLCSMLSTRGDTLSLLCRNDNFIVDDVAASSFEVPFLSLDHNALAAQLAKLKLSKRIFIDAKYIPEEMENDISDEMSVQESYHKEASREHSSRLHVCIDDKTKILPNDDISRYVEGKDILPNNIGEKPFAPLSSCEDTQPNPTSSSVSLDVSSASNTKADFPSRFVDAASEVELDMLLESFTETKPFDSSGVGASSTNPSPRLVTQHLSGSKSDQLSRNDLSDSSYAVKGISPESTVDGLVGDQPVCSSQRDAGSNNTVFLGAPAQSHTSGTLFLDDTIDDLLAETSTDPRGQEFMKHHESEGKLNDANISSVRSHSATKALDDFDSWLDTL